MESLTNVTFEEIKVGDKASLSRNSTHYVTM